MGIPLTTAEAESLTQNHNRTHKMKLTLFLVLLSFARYRSLAFVPRLNSADYLLIQNGVREYFLPTLWCGIRNVAPYSNPGAVSLFYPHLDTCCKNHDLCPINVGRSECKYGICNPSQLTPILSCECENEFKTCLQS